MFFYNVSFGWVQILNENNKFMWSIDALLLLSIRFGWWDWV